MFVFHRLASPKVVDVGYVPVNAALLAKMQIRIEKRGNEEADYVSGRLFSWSQSSGPPITGFPKTAMKG
jgi:hypothetical protein